MSYNTYIINKEICCENCAYSKKLIKYSGRCSRNTDDACLNHGGKMDKIIVGGVKFTNRANYKYSKFEPYFESKDMFSDEDFEL